jgi:hypothetical protein
MDPRPFLIFERAQELLDERPALSYEVALAVAQARVRRGARMNIAYFVAAAFIVWSVLLVIGNIGKPRPVMTGAAGIAGVIIYTPIVFLLVYAGLHL